jgi:hypothetical protein
LGASGLLGLGELDVDAVGGHVAALHEPLDAALGRVLLGVLLAAEAGGARGALVVDGDEAGFRVGEDQRRGVGVELEVAAVAPSLVGGGFVGEGGEWTAVGLSEPWEGVSECAVTEGTDWEEWLLFNKLTQSQSSSLGSRERLRSEMARCWRGESGFGFISCSSIQAFRSR